MLFLKLIKHEKPFFLSIVTYPHKQKYLKIKEWIMISERRKRKNIWTERKPNKQQRNAINIYPNTPPAKTSAWADKVSAMVSSLYIATGVLYCLLTMLFTGDGGIYKFQRKIQIVSSILRYACFKLKLQIINSKTVAQKFLCFHIEKYKIHWKLFHLCNISCQIDTEFWTWNTHQD